jgi:hypothetical protein
MGYNGRINDKTKALELRKKGFSYNEILKQVHVSKDTISRWCRDVVLTKQQEKRLMDNKLFGQKKGSLVAANNKREFRNNRINEINIEAEQEVSRLTKRDRFMTGIALYAGEGDKTEGRAGFSNADPEIIRFMMKWFLEFTNLPMSKYHGAIWIHDGLNERKAKVFWSTITGIPIKQFYKTYVVLNKTNPHQVRKNIHEYGIFAIRFCNNEVQRKILGWIFALFNDKISFVP